MNKNTAPPSALTIAGSDSGGGAGIQADIKAFSSTGVHPCTVITALTAQNTRGVRGISPVETGFIEQQLDSILTDVSISAVKTGMLYKPEVIELIARRSEQLPRLVVDPVMVAESGDSLLEPAAEEIIVNRLLPEADLITPNWPETCKIAEQKDFSPGEDVETLGDKLSESLDGPAVLIKGGHRNEEKAVDFLFSANNSSPRRISAPRIETVNTHGTGCTYSALITGFLAREKSISAAVIQAKEMLTLSLKQSYQYGQGAGTVNLLVSEDE